MRLFRHFGLKLNSLRKAILFCGVVYRQHNSPDRFLEHFEETVDRYCATDKSIYLLGDVNINFLKSKTCNYAQQFLNCLKSYAILPILPTIDKTTRVNDNSASLIDNIFLNKFEDYIPLGILFQISPIIFLNFAFLNRLLKSPNLEKWQLVTI